MNSSRQKFCDYVLARTREQFHLRAESSFFHFSSCSRRKPNRRRCYHRNHLLYQCYRHFSSANLILWASGCGDWQDISMQQQEVRISLTPARPSYDIRTLRVAAAGGLPTAPTDRSPSFFPPPLVGSPSTPMCGQKATNLFFFSVKFLFQVK